jgi:hypothetical protein
MAAGAPLIYIRLYTVLDFFGPLGHPADENGWPKRRDRQPAIVSCQITGGRRFEHLTARKSRHLKIGAEKFRLGELGRDPDLQEGAGLATALAGLNLTRGEVHLGRDGGGKGDKVSAFSWLAV